MYDVMILVDDEHVLTLPLDNGLVGMGRAPSNTVVLAEAEVAWHQCLLWVDGGQPWIRDVGGGLGTRVAGVRIDGPAVLAVGAKIEVGRRTRLGVLATELGACSTRPRLRLRHVGSGVSLALPDPLDGQSSSFRYGLHVGPRRTLAQVRRAGDAVLVEHEKKAALLQPGEGATVGGQRYQLERVRPPEADLETDSMETSIAIGRTFKGYSAELGSRARQLAYRDNSRALLLYLLALRQHRDRAAGVDPSLVGRCAADELIQQLWGRLGTTNNLAVLVHRVRSDLRSAGFTGNILERGADYVRLVVGVVHGAEHAAPACRQSPDYSDTREMEPTVPVLLTGVPAHDYSAASEASPEERREIRP